MSDTTYSNIRPATLLGASAGPEGDQVTTELSFRVPLDHNMLQAGTIDLQATMVHAVGGSREEAGKYANLQDARPILAFLCGGPGTANNPTRMPSLNRALVTPGGFLPGTSFQVLYLDYRGTGRSSAVTASTIPGDSAPAAQAAYLAHFRQDNIVRDLEAVRLCLSARLWPGQPARPWSIMGQSFGGWVALTYLSFRPAGLGEVFLAGGLAPIAATADQVYAETYKQVSSANAAFYAHDPRNADRVRRVAAHLARAGAAYALPPSGDPLTVGRLMVLGRGLGATGGAEALTDLLAAMDADVRGGGRLSAQTLARVAAASVDFGGRPLYAALHEAIYCDGGSSRWAAERVGAALPGYGWLRAGPLPGGRLLFAGEMIYPLHLRDFGALRWLAPAAQELARRAGWPRLYDRQQLARDNKVPVCAVGYAQDMYVSAVLGRQTAGMVRGLRYHESPELLHDAIRTNTETVLGWFARMRAGV